MVIRRTKQSISIQRDDDMVILTMTPQRAQLIAASIWLGEGNHRGWLDDLSELLESAAEGSGVFGAGQAAIQTFDVTEDEGFDLALPRDRVPVEHDPVLDTLFSPAALAAAMATPAETSVEVPQEQVTPHAAEVARD